MNGSDYLLDSNVWVALTFDAHPAHQATRHLFTTMSRDRPACFCRSTQQSFLRLASTPAILAAYGLGAMTNADVLKVYENFMANSAVAYREEPADISSFWPRIAARSTASAKLWMDAYLTAFAMAGHYQFITLDSGFSQFESLAPIILSV